MGQTRGGCPYVGANRVSAFEPLTLALSRKGRGNDWNHFVVN